MSITRIIYFSFSIMMIFSCGNSSNTSFDEVEYYRLKESVSIGNLMRKDYSNNNDELLYNILFEKFPESINDTTFLDSIILVGYEKIEVKPKQIRKLNDLLCTEPLNGMTLGNWCGYFYEDVLILRKNSSIIGIVKLYFDCGNHHVITDGNLRICCTDQELKSLLRNN